MVALVILGRVVLSAVFAVAGISKLASFSQSRESAVEFGVPSPFALPFMVALISCELAVAIALIPAPSAWYAAIVALTLFALFSGVIAANLIKGKRPTCNCFGQLHPTEIGWPTFARNILLAAIAALVVAEPTAARTSLFTWTHELNTMQAVSLAAIAIATALLVAIVALLLQVVRQQGRMLLRFDAIEHHLGVVTDQAPAPVGLQPGSPAPAFALRLLDGRELSLEELLQPKKPALLVFSNPSCGPCQELLPQIAQWQQEFAEKLSIALLSEGSAEDNRSKFGSSGLAKILLQKQRETAEAYQVYATPSAVMIAPNASVASYVAQGSDEIQKLIFAFRSGALEPALAARGMSPGDDIPEIALKTLDGKEFALTSLRGASALLVFWNQHCGFCQQMIPELRAWEAAPHTDGPRMILVSGNAADEHKGLDVASMVLLDQESRASAAFGARGTPMGILIGPDGRIASHLVAGAKEIFALADRARTVRSNGHVAVTVGSADNGSLV
jgi:thiol-disulfide isomerase/thioredoxin/uncharacterized membrane protein YphA (DoxX/SURF4 family)